MTRFLASILLALAVSTATRAADPTLSPAAERARVQKLIEGLQPKSGKIALEGGLATIDVPEDYGFLGPKDAETVLSDIWHNPPGGHYLGLIVPKGFLLSGPNSWAAIMQYGADGYVDDKDAAGINYDTLLKQMQDAARAENPERVKNGYPSMELVGWAKPPRYDAATHKLYWAKRYRFDDKPNETLNYNIRMLGRHGVLVINIISSMSRLHQVELAAPAILSMVNFQAGSRYADFDPGTDRVATYGLAALVAGGIAAKAGLFKLIWVGLLAAKKFVILAAVAVAGYFKKLFRKKDPRVLE